MHVYWLNGNLVMQPENDLERSSLAVLGSQFKNTTVLFCLNCPPIAFLRDSDRQFVLCPYRTHGEQNPNRPH